MYSYGIHRMVSGFKAHVVRLVIRASSRSFLYGGLRSNVVAWDQKDVSCACWANEVPGEARLGSNKYIFMNVHVFFVIMSARDPPWPLNCGMGWILAICMSLR